MQWISQLAEDLLASQEGLCHVELIKWTQHVDRKQGRCPKLLKITYHMHQGMKEYLWRDYLKNEAGMGKQQVKFHDC